jgi:hypothetical protein
VTSDKPICSLSLDLDNQWSYMKTHGDAGWETFPSYLDLVVPRILEVLDEFGWKITVFVVGQDAALDKNRDALKMIADAGHEIGNHSFNHEPWLHLYSKQQIEDEIRRAEEAIESSTGDRPVGFRGPGYSLSRDVLGVLEDRGYEYDASTFPTFLGPLARAYYFLNSRLSGDEKKVRKALFGRFTDGFQRNSPYRWSMNGGSLVEIPVTTMPLFRIPVHFSYVLYINSISARLARWYFELSVAMFRITHTTPSLLLHPLDFLGGDDLSELDFFPAMNVQSSQKIDLLKSLFHNLSTKYSVVNISQQLEDLEGLATTRKAH